MGLQSDNLKITLWDKGESVGISKNEKKNSVFPKRLYCKQLNSAKTEPWVTEILSLQMQSLGPLMLVYF